MCYISSRIELPEPISPDTEKKSGKVPGLIQSLIMSNTTVWISEVYIDREKSRLGVLCPEKSQGLGLSAKRWSKSWVSLCRLQPRLGDYLAGKTQDLGFFLAERIQDLIFPGQG